MTSNALWFTAVLAASAVAICGAYPSALQEAQQEAPANPPDVEPLGAIKALIDDGRHSSAEMHARVRLADLERTAGVDAVDLAPVLDLLVEALWRQGKAHVPETLELAERALRIREAELGKDHPSLGFSLENLGVLLDLTADRRPQQGHAESSTARSLFERSLSIREKALGPDHPDVARSLDRLGTFHQERGDFVTAKQMYERSLAIRNEKLDPWDYDTSVTLNLLGVLLWETGEYAAARPLYERALAIRLKSRRPDHPGIAGVLVNFAILTFDMGDYEAARQSHERALATQKRNFGPDSPLVAGTLVNLAHVFWRTGDYDRAELLLQRALGIWKARGDSLHLNVASALDLGARLAQSRGDHASASKLQEQALAIWEPGLGADHPIVALGLSALADSLRFAGNNEASMSNFLRARDVFGASLGEDHPYFGANETNLAKLYFEIGDRASALSSALAAERSGRNHLRLTTRSLSERQSLSYASVRASGLDLGLTLAQQGLDPASRWEVLDALIRSRALVLDEMGSRRRLLSDVDDPEIVELVKRLTSARTTLANLVVRSVFGDPARHRTLVDRARMEKESAERALAAKSRAFRNEQARERIGLGEVQKELPSSSALVAMAWYRHQGTVATGDPLPSYLAFVLRKDSSAPTVVRLGPASLIDGEIRKWKHEAADGVFAAARSPREAEAAYRKAGAALRRRIWDPIAAQLGDAELVFVVPDGALQLVSLATLPTDDGNYLVEAGPSLHYFSAERDLALLSRSETRGEGLLALGAPDFDATTLFAALSPNDDEPAVQEASPRTPPEGRRRSSCSSFRSSHFSALPATATEVKQIAGMWDGQTGRGAVSLTGLEATEGNFKTNAPGKRVLHLATHGFFLNVECASALRGSRGIGGLSPVARVEPPSATGENPLLLPGLALAGANNRLSARGDEEDGILTAEEIAALDLSGVEWAVLSACDTGVGEIRSGEGVFGLRRAFQIAGARTLVMSLWAVDDDATGQWMDRLYQGRLGGLSTVDAVRGASVDSIDSRRRRGRDTHPFYWGAFVAAGDWR